MKNKLNIILVVFTLLSIGFTSSAFANNEKKNAEVEVKFIGNHKDQPVIEVQFNQADESEYIIEVVDEYNYLLYKDVVKVSNGVRRFILNTEELGNTGVRFTITGRKNNKSTVFDVNRNARMVEDLVVSKRK